MSSTTCRYRAGKLDRDRQIGYGLRGTVTAGDGSNQRGGFKGAGCVNSRKKRKRQKRKVGHEEQGSSSNRQELATFVLALRGTPVTTPMLYLCDNQALLKAVKRWAGEGGKATLVRRVPEKTRLKMVIKYKTKYSMVITGFLSKGSFEKRIQLSPA